MKRQELSPEVEALWEGPLPREEFEARVRLALDDAQSIADNIELIEWFSRRYPTAQARLAYARRKYKEAMRRSGSARPK